MYILGAMAKVDLDQRYHVRPQPGSVSLYRRSPRDWRPMDTLTPTFGKVADEATHSVFGTTGWTPEAMFVPRTLVQNPAIILTFFNPDSPQMKIGFWPFSQSRLDLARVPYPRLILPRDPRIFPPNPDELELQAIDVGDFKGPKAEFSDFRHQVTGLVLRRFHFYDQDKIHERVGSDPSRCVLQINLSDRVAEAITERSKLESQLNHLQGRVARFDSLIQRENILRNPLKELVESS
jgi:hypothetical protein